MKKETSWQKKLREYFNKHNGLVGEHWIEGMIRIVEGILDDQNRQHKEELKKTLNKMLKRMQKENPESVVLQIDYFEDLIKDELKKLDK